jgi:hypothetical protein
MDIPNPGMRLAEVRLVVKKKARCVDLGLITGLPQQESAISVDYL